VKGELECGATLPTGWREQASAVGDDGDQEGAFEDATGAVTSCLSTMPQRLVETSILASLDELKAIHHQRIADERDAVESERRARADAIRQAENTRIAADQTRERDARDAVEREHAARTAAEREARLRVVAATEAEQVRLGAELAARRQEAELELRRETIAKQRPRWMIAVTALAVCAVVVLGFAAVNHERAAAAARAREVAAQNARDVAVADARAAKAQLERVDGEIAQLQDQVDHAIDRVVNAQRDADRRQQLDELHASQKRLADAKQRHEDYIKAQQAITRHNGIHEEGCAKTGLGCIDGRN
jgi:colicin import membrane protein